MEYIFNIFFNLMVHYEAVYELIANKLIYCLPKMCSYFLSKKIMFKAKNRLTMLGPGSKGVLAVQDNTG